MAKFPSSKSVWNISEPEPGALGSHDPAVLQVSRKALSDEIPFGVFVAPGSGGADFVAGTDTEYSGVTLIDNLASDYANKEYDTNDLMAIGRRGFFIVKIDTTYKPTAGGSVKVSHASATKGYLTSSTTNSSELDGTYVEITQVYDTVAEVYLSGAPEIPISAAEAAS